VIKFADLHIHTYFSDSTSSPQEVIADASGANLSCIAITDHDTLDGVEPTRIAAKNCGIEVIAGIELSTEMHDKDIHMLGYFIDLHGGEFKEMISQMRIARIERIKEMIQKLKNLGLGNIDFEESFGSLSASSLGRPHLAAVLLQRGDVSSLSEAFEKYLGEGCPAYVKKFKISPYDAIALIRRAGGVAVMAHPMITAKDELIPGFVEAGLEGIEAYYPYYSQASIRFYEGIAKKHHLVTTGGSDAHGKAKTNTFIGKVRIPYDHVEQLKERISKR